MSEHETTRPRLWRCVVAVLAVHVLDDNFVQPEPGTDAGGHLASGLIPILVLVVAAAVYPHLRAGSRAVAAMTLGTLALVIGAPAAYYLRHGTVEGDHYTGLLALVAGTVLLLVGPVTLWRHRRTSGSRRQRYLRRALMVAVTPVMAIAIVWFVVFPVGMGYLYTHTARQPTTPDLGVAQQSVVVPTDDGLALTGFYVPARNGAAILLYPGAGREDEARMLIAHGFGVLLLDPRGQGGSEGDTVLWAGDEDLLAGADYLEQRPDVERIGAIGFSVGGEMLLRAAAEFNSIQAVVSEGAGERVGEADASGLLQVLVDPSQAVMTAATSIFSNRMPPRPIVDGIGDIAPRPVLLMYADPGIGGEGNRQPEYFDAAGEPKSIWKIPGASHTGGIDAEPDEYERRVTAFFEASLLDRNHPPPPGRIRP